MAQDFYKNLFWSFQVRMLLFSMEFLYIWLQILACLFFKYNTENVDLK